MPPTKSSQARAEIGESVLTVAAGFGAPRHPTATASRKNRNDFFDLNPQRIIESGPYVREVDFDEDFDAFCASIKERGQIDHPISVRNGNSPSEFILVWGKRRLHAALRLGLEKIPVRNLGAVDELGAMKLQLQENLARKPMSPVERALSFWELSARGLSNADIAAVIGKSASYVSYMIKTGEGLAALTEEERRQLNVSNVLSVRACQVIAQRDTVDDRAADLRQMLMEPTPPANRSAALSRDEDDEGQQAGLGKTPDDEGPNVRERLSAQHDPGSSLPISRVSRPDEEAPFVVKDLRGGQGRSFRVRWYNRDLRDDPESFVAQFLERLQMEKDLLVSRLKNLEHSARSGTLPDTKMADRLARAHHALAKQDEQIAS